MMFAKSTNGAARASGKAKGAFGIKHMLDAVMAVAMDEAFLATAVDTVRTVTAVAAKWELDRPSDSMSGEYTVQQLDDQAICNGNLWLELGRGYTFTVHWEFLSAQQRRAVELTVLKDGQPIRSDPKIVKYEDYDDPTNVDEIYEEIRTLIRYIGESDYSEETTELS